MPIIKDHVTTITTPGEDVDVLVTERGIAINPRRVDLLEKLEGLQARFEEVSTLITDPNVIADQQRYVRLTKEYKELKCVESDFQVLVSCFNLDGKSVFMAVNT